MTIPPIVAHFEPDPPEHRRASVYGLAEALRREHAELSIPEHLEPLMVHRLVDAPALVFDDLSAIRRPERTYDLPSLEERCRLRAGTGDLVATCLRTVSEFKVYCRDTLDLGSPEWLHPRPCKDPHRLAQACWADRDVRRRLVHAIRSEGLAYLHPHMGIRDAWELGALLRNATRLPILVLAPPPGLCAFVNDKLAFADVVKRLIGERAVPRTENASNFAILSQHVRDLAPQYEHIGVKLTDSAGGDGTIVMEAARFRELSLLQIRRKLKRLLDALDWKCRCPVLVGGWEDAVLCSPSVQLWIPPPADGQPIVEGIFQQILEGPECSFAGSGAAKLPEPVLESLASDSWLLGSLFQNLGYVGRCSMDALLVGPDLTDCRVEFIECNGRWGGTSIPMTLMNRLFGDWESQPYVCRECAVEGLDRVSFAGLLAHFSAELLDARTRTGRLIFYNPSRIREHSAINAIGLGSTREEARHLVSDLVPKRLRELVAATNAG